ncbi:MAG: right-handed parallel beta-helix repeat-containing protein [Phycisphaerales bacterium]|nr:right-handed parallel beta-helix repeat-containing protein [Phycisphaerales bacterium]
MNKIVIVSLLAFVMFVGSALAGNATVPGEVTTPYPTITNLAVEWAIEGDDNLNATCEVKYRELALGVKAAWQNAMPLRRIPAGESITTNPIFKWTNRLSGSIFDLKPDTEYEIQLTLKDPDGGNAERTVKARTRPVPKAAANAPVRNVDPSTIHSVLPGEIGLLADGDYGNFVAKNDGQPGKPIVYRAAGKAVKFTSVSLIDRKHVYVEGLIIRPTGRNAAVYLIGAEDCVVRRCDIKGVYGIRAHTRPGCKNCYFADNIVIGTTPWTVEAMGASGQNVGEGIEITGSGNVICYNYVSNFRDCISFMEDNYTADQHCIDVYNNDIAVGADDAIEADFAMSNCRILRNRIVNSYVGLSSQPGLGGPTYFIRNVMYNLTGVPFKLHRRSYGDVILHNTVVRAGDGMVCYSGLEFDHALLLNNLCIGGPPFRGGSGRVINFEAAGEHCTIDYNAVGSWNMPFKGKINKRFFNSVEEMRQGPHQTHGIAVGLDVFNDVAFPDKPLTLYAPPDLRPKAGAAVVGVGVVIANVNDRYNGKLRLHPTIGAYEPGEPLPHYGPRPEGVDESTKQ